MVGLFFAVSPAGDQVQVMGRSIRSNQVPSTVTPTRENADTRPAGWSTTSRERLLDTLDGIRTGSLSPRN